MTTSLIDEMKNRPQVLVPGNYSCSGCGLALAFKTAMPAVNNPIIVIPASCASVIQGEAPNVGYNAPVLNIAFAAHAAAASGVVRAKKARGEEVTVVVWSGDGGSFDIGMATLSGAAERNENIIHCVYDNGFYGNTGVQRSGATPRGSMTTTTPLGKEEKRKSLARIVAAHDVPYIATASVGYPRDLYRKMRKAASIEGFKFLLIDAPCPLGWYADPKLTMELGQLAVKTGYFPVYEIENGKLSFTSISKRYKDPEKRLPLDDYIRLQGRFRRMTPEHLNALKMDIQNEWDMLIRLE